MEILDTIDIDEHGSYKRVHCPDDKCTVVGVTDDHRIVYNKNHADSIGNIKVTYKLMSHLESLAPKNNINQRVWDILTAHRGH